MKIPIFLACLLVAVFLPSCNLVSQSIEKPPAVITVEVTRIAPVTTPVNTPASTATLDEMKASATAFAKEIGTPIVASDECGKTAQSQMELNACAETRLNELKQQMAELFKVLETRYQQHFPEGLKKFQNFQAEWKDLSERECKFRSGLDSDNWPGTMAIMNYDECMVKKYEARLRELQIEIFIWNR